MFSCFFSKNVNFEENIKAEKTKNEKLLQRKQFLESNNNKLRYLLLRWVYNTFYSVNKKQSVILPTEWESSHFWSFRFREENHSLNSELSLLQDVKHVSLGGQISLQKLEFERIQNELQKARFILEAVKRRNVFYNVISVKNGIWRDRVLQAWCLWSRYHF